MNTMMSLLGNRNESERSTTYATIGGNIELDIRDEAGQKARTGKTVEETLSGLHRDIDKANGKVNPPDMREVEGLRAMAAVIVDIVNNAEQIYTHSERERIEKAKLALGKEAERLRQAGVLPENFAKDADYKAAAKALDNVQSDYDKKYGTGSAFRRGVSAASAVLQGLLTGNNRQALVGGLSPYANEFIKGQTEENSLENKIAHGILSAVEFQLTGQSAYLGALTGIVAESSAEILAGIVYGKAPGELTEGEKQQVVALSQAAAALATVVAGGNGETAASAMASAKSAVENNFLSQSEYAELDRLMDKKNLTVEEATRVQYLLEKDKISNQLLDRWQQDPDSLSQQDRELLFKWVREYGNTPSQLKLLETPAYAPQLKPDYSDLKFRAQRIYNYAGSFDGRMSESLSNGLFLLNSGGIVKTATGVVSGLERAGVGIQSKVKPLLDSTKALAQKYPTTTGMLTDGSISLSAHIGYKVATNQEVNPTEALGAFSGGALTRDKSLGNQIRINIGIATVSSLSKDPSGKELTNDYFGAFTSPIIGKPFENMKYGSVIGGFLGEYSGDLGSINKELEKINTKFKGISNED